MRHVPATRLVTQTSPRIINKDTLPGLCCCVAMVSVRVPVVTPRTALLKPTSWVWYCCLLLFFQPRSFGAGSVWELWGDPLSTGIEQRPMGGHTVAGYWATVKNYIALKINLVQVLERNEHEPCLWQQRWNVKRGKRQSRAHVSFIFQIFTEVSLLQLKWAEFRFTGHLQCVNVLGQKSHLGPGPRRSNGGFTRLINKPWAR